LHEDKYYEGKYPAPAQLPTQEQLIAWEKMIKTRASNRTLPILKILSRIQELGVKYNAQINLVGSWANGSWVSRTPSENKFPSGFLSLRQMITGNTGSSDIDLLVYSESSTLDTISAALKKDKIVKASGYTVNLFSGKKDAQRGIPLSKLVRV